MIKKSNIVISEDSLRKAIEEAHEYMINNDDYSKLIPGLVMGLESYFHLSPEDLAAFKVEQRSDLLNDEIAPDFANSIREDVIELSRLTRKGRMNNMITTSLDKEAGFVDDTVKGIVQYLKSNKDELVDLFHSNPVKLHDALEQVPQIKQNPGILNSVRDWLDKRKSDVDMVGDIEKEVGKKYPGAKRSHRISADAYDYKSSQFSYSPTEYAVGTPLVDLSPSVGMEDDMQEGDRNEVVDKVYTSPNEIVVKSNMGVYYSLEPRESYFIPLINAPEWVKQEEAKGPFNDDDRDMLRGMGISGSKKAAPQMIGIAAKLQADLKDIILGPVRDLMKKIGTGEEGKVAKECYFEVDEALHKALKAAERGAKAIETLAVAKKESKQMESKDDEKSMEKKSSKKFLAAIDDFNHSLESYGVEHWLDDQAVASGDYLMETLPEDKDSYPVLCEIKDLLTTILEFISGGEVSESVTASFKVACADCGHNHADTSDSNTSAHVDYTDLGVESFFKEQDAKYATLDSAKLMIEARKFAAELEEDSEFKALCDKFDTYLDNREEEQDSELTDHEIDEAFFDFCEENNLAPELEARLGDHYSIHGIDEMGEEEEDIHEASSKTARKFHFKCDECGKTAGESAMKSCKDCGAELCSSKCMKEHKKEHKEEKESKAAAKLDDYNAPQNVVHKDDLEKAITLIEESSDKLEGKTIAEVEAMLTKGGIPIDTAKDAIAQLFGPEALVVGSEPVEKFL